jgi:hypothetical protein
VFRSEEGEEDVVGPFALDPGALDEVALAAEADALQQLRRADVAPVAGGRDAVQPLQIFATQVAPTLAAALGTETAGRRAGLVSAQLLGLGLSRYLLRLPAVTALTRDEIEDTLAPAIEAVLAPE